MADSPEDHVRVRPRLAAFAAGLLGDGDTERVARHVEGCADCRAALGRGESEAMGSQGHLPAEMTSHWGEQGARLRGLQRELVRRHLDRCEECRQVLRVLGHAPVLDRVPELEPSPTVMRLLGQGEDRPVVVMPSRPVWARREFWLGSVAGGLVAAAAALVLVLNPALHPGSGPEVVPESGPTPGPVAPTAVLHGPRLELGLVGGVSGHTLSSLETGVLLRDAEPPDSIIVVKAGQRVVRIGLTSEEIPPTSQVELELVAPDGGVLDRAAFSYRLLFEQGRSLAIIAPDSLPSGRLLVRLTGVGGDGKKRMFRYPVRIEH